MPAPKKNSFWKLRSKHGRDKIFESPQILWEAVCEYFEACDLNPWKEEKISDNAEDKQNFAACLKAYFDIEGITFQKTRERDNGKQVTKWKIVQCVYGCA